MSSRPRALLLLVLLLMDFVAVSGLLLLFLLVGGQRAVDDGGVVAEHFDRQRVEAFGGQRVRDFFELVGMDADVDGFGGLARSEEHTSELQSQSNLVCRLLLEKKKKKKQNTSQHR